MGEEHQCEEDAEVEEEDQEEAVEGSRLEVALAVVEEVVVADLRLEVVGEQADGEGLVEEEVRSGYYFFGSFGVSGCCLCTISWLL